MCIDSGMLTVPLVGRVRPARSLSVVVFPDPDPPTIPSRSPRDTVKLMSSTAVVDLNFFVRFVAVMTTSSDRFAGRGSGNVEASISERVYGCSGAVRSLSTGASSTTRPSFITNTRSHVCATKPRSWVINSSPVPRSATSFKISSTMARWLVTSSAVVGSSQISSSGSCANAMAISTRCRCPPDSWCGYRLAMSAGSSTFPNSSTARAMAWRLVTRKCVSTASATCLPTFMSGFNAVMGS